ncbi:Elongation factor 1-gamma [Chionoecetes opilio]|uniref:Elongation factor 1-gamma n=1 Tax=Chionoecetes opilio TaxID=41210 RepID=A0A8J4YH18_CHIOP|nr:Elongation factor 1-gamma [Chionoecetes opilio]
MFLCCVFSPQTLYTYPENFRAFKVLVAAQYSGAKVTTDPAFVFGDTNKTPAFLNKFPLGKVPAFESSDGRCIFESNAICWAVANDELRGASPMDQAQVVAWMSFADNEILPASCTWVFPCMGIMSFNKGNTERAKEDVRKALQCLNTHLLTRTFLVGERITLADVSVCCTLLHLYQYVLDAGFRKPFQNANRWFTTMINQPQVKAVIGDLKMCDKMAQFDPKKFAEVQGKIKQSGGGEKVRLGWAGVWAEQGRGLRLWAEQGRGLGVWAEQGWALVMMWACVIWVPGTVSECSNS